MKNALALGVVLVLLLLGGCGGGDSESAARPLEERIATLADAPTPAEGTLDPSGDYIGSWTADLTLDELGAAAADTRYVGEFRLELRDDGTYTTFQELDGEGSGEYGAAPGNFLVFSKDSLCGENFPGTSVYEWSVEGDELTLTLVRPESGGCTGRSDTLSFPRWKRS